MLRQIGEPWDLQVANISLNCVLVAVVEAKRVGEHRTKIGSFLGGCLDD